MLPRELSLASNVFGETTSIYRKSGLPEVISQRKFGLASMASL